MFIVDLNQTMISNFMVSIGKHTNIVIDENLLRSMVLNSIRGYNRKFKQEFGEMIIACDDTNYWRRSIFPYYKASRKSDREKSEIDWSTVFKSLNKIREELKTYFPYRVIQVATAEADDIIGTLAHEFGNTNEKVLILSGDKDFRQLQTYMNVTQYDPVRKKWMTENNPERYLHEHIMRGDRGDGVPNFLSRDDSFVVNIRQKPIRETTIKVWLDQAPSEFCDEAMLKGYNRNQQLVDLNYIPSTIRQSVIESFQAQADKPKQGLFNYFVEHKLKHLLTDISDF